MADIRRLVVSDLLCYAINKFGRVSSKPLKSVINDFYSADEICAAKDILIEEVDQLNLDKWSKPARRRKDSITRTQNEIDDIFNIIVMLDDAISMNRLPTFVSTDPDRMPSIKLTDGDLACLMMKVNSLEQNVIKIRDDITNLPTKLDLANVAPGKVSSAVVSHNGAVAASAPTYLDVARPKNSASIPQHSVSFYQTGAEQVSYGHTSSDAGEMSDLGEFTQGRIRKKRKQLSPLSASASQMDNDHSYAPSLQLPGTVNVATRNKPQPKAIIGASSHSALKASKSLIVKKAVFLLGNIDSVYSSSDVENYIRSLDIRILTCFELKPTKFQASDNKSFRVCIIAEDKAKLCNTDNWSVGVCVRGWVHKPKSEHVAVAANSDSIEMLNIVDREIDHSSDNPSNVAGNSCIISKCNNG
jgi:hypothetical protein